VPATAVAGLGLQLRGGARMHLAVWSGRGWLAAWQVGHVLAMYNLAMMNLGSGTPEGCDSALAFLKKVAERGPWAGVLQVRQLRLRSAELSFDLLWSSGLGSVTCHPNQETISLRSKQSKSVTC
jgi:TPR repeat protein